jgi:GNAT superfamily N-acetyltransferase
MSAARITVVPGNEGLHDAVRSHAALMHGAWAHQASARYRHWLYSCAPHVPEGIAAMRVALDEQQRVIGIADRMFLPWMVHGTVERIPALIDLSVREEHRSGGAGVRLILSASTDVSHLYVNGSNANSAPVFRGLRYQELTGAFWGRMVLSPLGTAWKLARQRIAASPGAAFDMGRMLPHLDLEATTTPTAAVLNELAALAASDPVPVRPHWTADMLHWRFFHAEGPPHVLLVQRSPARAIQHALIATVGIHRGLHVLRPLLQLGDVRLLRTHTAPTLVREAARAGVHVMAVFAWDTNESQVWRSLGCLERKDVPGTFFQHKRRSDMERFNHVRVPAAASDLGFDAIVPGL